MEDFIKIIDDILTSLDNHQSGDLLNISEIISKIKFLNNYEIDENPIKEYPDSFDIIFKSLKLSTIDSEGEKTILGITKNIVLLIKKYYNKLIEEKDFKKEFEIKLNELLNISQNIEEKINKQKKEILKSYPADYFNNIVEDTKLLSQFFDEANEHLDQAQYSLIELEYDSLNQELINNIFRNFHTIKGSSAFLGLKNIESLTHKLENLFDLIRKKEIKISKDIIDIIFYGMNIIRTILDLMPVCNFKKDELKKSFEAIYIFDYINLMDKILNEYKTKKIGEILVDFGKISLTQLQEILKKQEKKPEKKIGEILVEENIIKQDDLLIALQKQNEQKLKKKKTGYVKVSNERLNVLVDIVGELVTNLSMIKQEIIKNNIRIQNIDRTLTDFESITTTIKNIVLSMGMSPIEEIFNKLKVVARNTANELEKIVFVEIEGGETELDRNVMETIYEPLLHMVRNAIDHGIEHPTEREKAGKNKVGKITLKAEHKGSGIEIAVIDDGKGIDKSKIIDKAIKMKLIDGKDKLNEKDIYNFLFLPGFTTSENITTVSGRGVGLDVVKKNIESIHGRVIIDSEPGKGTSFIIRLPLTLAIIEGFVTKVNDIKYVFPFNLVEEILVLEKQKIQINKERESIMIYHRGNYIPVLLLQSNYIDIFKNKNDTYLSVILNFNQSKYCIVVDEIIGKQEIVIKILNSLVNKNNIFSGGTIFGDGTIGFVVDVQGLLDSLYKELKS